MAAAQEGNRPPPDSGVLEKVNDWRLRNASAREAPPLQPSVAGRSGLYIQDIHTFRFMSSRTTATKQAKSHSAMSALGVRALSTDSTRSTTRMTFSGQGASGFI